jgi:hypothetical protein
MKLRAALALCGLLSTALIACGPPPSKNTARKVGKEAKVGDNAPKSLSDIKFEESPRGGDPAKVGCADGQREGFADLTKFPTVAGCMGVWDGEMTLRKGKTSKACGDDLDVCGSPADVCAPGWHVCARDGDYHDLTDRLDDKQCSEGAGPGRFNAAISHVKKKKECAPPPGPTTRYPCLKSGYGAEPVCCGKNCRSGECRDAVWPKQTKISVGKAQGCGSVGSERNGGVLCCKDAEAPAPAPAPAPTAPPTGAEEGATAEPTSLGGPAEGKDPTGADKKDDAKKDDAKKDDAKKDDAE